MDLQECLFPAGNGERRHELGREILPDVPAHFSSAALTIVRIMRCDIPAVSG